MNIALVYDRINKFGGAERVLLALHDVWPRAPLYTAVYHKPTARWADRFDVRETFLGSIPFARRHNEFFAWLTPLAFETFSFDGYDCVLSVTSAEAKFVITKPETTHICYCLTPTRYLWSGYEDYCEHPGTGGIDWLSKRILPRVAPMLRRWDYRAAARPDAYIAISQRVKERIRRYYGREVDAVVYPPVDTGTFRVESRLQRWSNEPYYLTVSRLVGYKRVDLLVEAFSRLGRKLVVIGNGKDHDKLIKQAGPTVRFIDKKLTDGELRRYYQGCRAFVFAADEDFGIAAAEAQACGKPVIAYRHSGISEIVKHGITGILFDTQSIQSIIRAVTALDRVVIDEAACRRSAERFSLSRFRTRMASLVQSIVERRRKTL